LFAFFALFGTLELKTPKMVKKGGTTPYKCVLDLDLTSIFVSAFSIWSQKVKIPVPRVQM
jgi:hypothetical protein